MQGYHCPVRYSVVSYDRGRERASSLITKGKEMKVRDAISYLQDINLDDEIMILWNTRDQYEYIYDNQLPLEVWAEAVRVFDRSDMQEFIDECHSLVVVAKDKLEGAE